MRVLVTGATGFLGEHLTLRLLAGGAQVRVLARSAQKAWRLVEQGAELVEGEITDSDALQNAVSGVQVVYHLAGKLYISGVPAEEYERIHVDGTRALLRLCQERDTIQRFVHCSTTGVLGAVGDQPVDEHAPFAPTNAYERTKLQAELLVQEAITRGFPAVIVRPGLVYGPGDLHLLGFFKAIQRGLFRPIGRKPVWLHPIYVDDMTEAFVQCARDSRALGQCFNIAGEQPVTIGRLATDIAHALGAGRPRGYFPLSVARALAITGDLLPPRLRQMAPMTSSRLDFLTHSRVYDVTHARTTLGFAASTELAEGIARTGAWYRQQGHLPTIRGKE
jgi:nucleoside-diphosphate-sugar epimerase